MLSTVYEGIPVAFQVPTVVFMGVIGAIAVVLTADPPEAGYGSLAADPLRLPDSTARPQLGAGGGRPAGGGVGDGRTGDGGSEGVDRPARRARWWDPVPVLPPRLELFRGRDRELADLLTLHDRLRDARTIVGRPGRRRRGSDRPVAPGVSGPVVLLIHGKPGVGKTALADELARRLAPQYPHGQVSVNLGTAGGARTPKEILKDLLLDLGWSEQEMPPTAVSRAMVFRSLTAGKRILFVLDAARHADQLRHVLPSDPSAAVIVTSRQDLGSDTLDGPSYALGVPDQDEALSIFRAASRTAESVRPECAVQVVELCGRLPLAIRAAAERVSEDGADVCQVAGLLRDPHTRLDWLDRPGRPLRTHFEIEYGRLVPRERRALAALSLIPSSTFIPWVLGPLLDLPPAEVEALVVRLAAAQLLDDLGTDEISEVARYGIHPLVRLFVVERVATELTVDERNAALARFDDAYHEVVSAVLDRLHPDYRDVRPRRWLAEDSKLPGRIADRPEAWVRAEYPNLLRVMSRPEAGNELCWRVGLWLNGCVATGVAATATLDAYDRAIRAAERDRQDVGVVDVLLAKATFLIAMERYRDADGCLHRVFELADRLRGSGDPALVREADRRVLAAIRKQGEAYLQAACYRQGLAVLEDAYRRADALDDADEQRLLRILLAEAHHVDTPEVVHDELLDPRLTDAVRYRIYLALAEAARRRREWQVAGDYFREALRFVAGDLRRMATIQYREARLLLEQGTEQAEHDGGSPESPAGPAVRAVRRAAAAAVTFAEIGNPVGALRAHCLLARTVLALGHPVEADHLTRAAEGELSDLRNSDEKPEVLVPLAARLNRLAGELRLSVGDYQAGRHLLLEAATEFGDQRNWAGLAGVLRLLERQAPAGSASMPVNGHDRPVPRVPAQRPEPVTLAPAAAEQVAARLSGQLLDRMRHEIRQAFVPAEPVAFRGAVGVTLDGVRVDGDDLPTWRVPVGTVVELTVLVVTGRDTSVAAGDGSELSGAPCWRDLLVSSGVEAEEVAVTLLVDAPFVEVIDPELHATCRSEGGRVRHDCLVEAAEPGAYDLRVTVLSGGRLVQSLPIVLRVDDVAGGAAGAAGGAAGSERR
ncbi:NB-ARC domain-containing protein [Plantactinospora sp. GCM10030261]|uniref:NB-ARC domain-containing protein n=1 Tax=Plantactinospora sp. GCM10030261 TaxID=3273420 RepID=UPI00360FBDDB